ncbi:MAG: mechanosensitive ion channel family protein [Pseudomonadota bacterium]
MTGILTDTRRQARLLFWGAMVLIFTALAVLTVSPAQAQLLDYGSLIGQPEEKPQQSTPAPSTGAGAATSTPFPSLSTQTQPLQSTPVAPTGNAPTIADYGLVAEDVPDPMLNATRQAVSLFRERLTSTLHRLPEAVEEIRTALAAASPTGRPVYFVGIALFALLLLMVGRAVAMLYAIYVARRLMIAIQRPNPEGYLGKLPVLAYRLFLTVIAVAITLAVAVSIGLFFYQEHEATQTTTIIVFAAYAIVITVDTIWRMAVAPYLSEYRLPVISDSDARSLYGWLSVATVFGIVSMAFASWMQALGLSMEVYVAITITLSLITVLIILAMIRAHRKTIGGMILAGRSREEVSWPVLAASSVWAPVITLYLLFSWGDMSFRLIMGIDSSPYRLIAPYAIFLAGMIVYAVASYIIERIFARNRQIEQINRDLDERRQLEEQEAHDAMVEDIRHAAVDAGDIDGDGDEEAAGARVGTDDPAPQYPIQRPGMQTMEDLARRTASLFAIGAVAYALARFWGGPNVFEDTPALNLFEDVIDIVFVGYITYHAVRIWIDQKIQEEGGDEEPTGPGEGEGGGAGATRLATLLPLFRNFFLIVIAVTVLLLIATELGVNVAPLFAGAGIVGLAIGFGAQTLVRDILSGAFFLMDDAFRKGEYIDVGDVKGTVEKISLRSFQLRHHLGMLHTIPFGEITHLTNFSRDWVMMKLPLRLTYDTDVERVRKLIKKLGLRLLEDPEIGEKFIQPVKSQGVIQMDDSAMIVRIKFMTRPGEQWVLRKRIYAEIRELFEKEGIKFAHREVTVRIPDLDERKGDLSEDQVKAIGAAARRVSDQVDEEGLLATGTGGMGDTR